MDRGSGREPPNLHRGQAEHGCPRLLAGHGWCEGRGARSEHESRTPRRPGRAHPGEQKPRTGWRCRRQETRASPLFLPLPPVHPGVRGLCKAWTPHQCTQSRWKRRPPGLRTIPLRCFCRPGTKRICSLNVLPVPTVRRGTTCSILLGVDFLIWKMGSPPPPGLL